MFLIGIGGRGRNLLVLGQGATSQPSQSRDQDRTHHYNPKARIFAYSLPQNPARGQCHYWNGHRSGGLDNDSVVNSLDLHGLIEWSIRAFYQHLNKAPEQNPEHGLGSLSSDDEKTLVKATTPDSAAEQFIPHRLPESHSSSPTRGASLSFWWNGTLRSQPARPPFRDNSVMHPTLNPRQQNSSRQTTHHQTGPNI
jgi:hypothetical protein